MQTPRKKDCVLADVIMRLVIKVDDRLTLHPRAAEVFGLALNALFKHPTLDAKEEIEAVMRLGMLFERDHAFELADEIVHLLAQDDRALSVLGISSVKKSREARKGFAKLVAANTQTLAAPVFGKQAPEGTVKLATFIDPGRQMIRSSAPRARPSTPRAMTARVG